MSERIGIDWACTETVNFAMQQNHVPVIKRLVLTNRTEEDMTGVTVVVSSEPPFAPDWSKTCDLLPAGQAVDLGVVPLQLSAAYLGERSERIAGTLKLSVLQGQTPIGEKSVPIAVLAFDEWSGLAVLPEMAAAFVTPNHPQVARVVREAADLLGKWSGDPSFTAYQSNDPNRAKMQAAALYAALQNQRIAYCVAPPSFEQIGQRVRLPETVFGQRMGNCLDLSLLYAACLEAVGLHPLLVFTEKHAFVGVWLVMETFSESVQDDMSLLTKRMASGIHEICAMESTAFVEGAAIPFEDAVKMAAAHLTDPAKFDCLIDVRRARSGAIRPLPLRVATPHGWEIETPPSTAAEEAVAPELLEVVRRPVETDAIPLTRQKLWERRLLDLSLRNALLNFRLSKSSVPLMTVHLGQLEDALAGREEFQVIAKPGDWQEDGRSAHLYQSIDAAHPLAALLREEFERKRLRADLPPQELDRRLVHLYRSARLSLEENGANSLYLALGLLKWYESAVSEMPRYAPIVLLPVEIIRKSSRIGYVIRMRDEEPQINVTLLEMLRQDYGITIDGLDPLPKDDRGIDLKQIFTTFRHALMRLTRWDVEETAYVGLFSFGQFVMWNDIRARGDRLAENSVVASLMAGRLSMPQQPTDSEEEARLDEEHPSRLLVPISADSSQLSAIRAAAGGLSFVLHGPPGTGKSQTITNMIASALANGKRVLFVAEKMAALTVVQNRLAQIGLGPFCLELHSNKSTKRAVLEQLNAAAEAGRLRKPDEWEAQAERLSRMRGELNGYVGALHDKQSFGFSLFEAISGYERAGQGPDVVRFDPSSIERLTPEQVTVWRDLAAQMRAACADIGDPLEHPWKDAGCAAYSQPFKAEVEALLARYVAKLDESEAALGQAAAELGIASLAFTNEQGERFVRLCDMLWRMPDLKGDLLDADDAGAAVAALKAVSESGKARDRIRDKVSATFAPDVLRFDAALVQAEWTKTELQWFLPRWMGQNRIVKLLGMLAASGRTIAKHEVQAHLADIRLWQEEERKLAELGKSAESWLGTGLWESGEGRWDGIVDSGEWLLELHKLLVSLFGAEAPLVRKRLGELVRGGAAGATTQSGIWRTAVEQYGGMLREEAELHSRLRIDSAQMIEAAGGNNRFSFMRAKAVRWGANLDALRSWCAWRKVRDEAIAAGLLPLVAPYERGLLANEQLVPAFERGMYKSCADAILSKDPRLSFFSGALFEETIRQFAETDRKYTELTRQEIVARLAAKVPQMSQEAAQSSEAGILQRAVRSGGRSVSIRKLFEQIPNLLPRLTPCMLMSPISVAQYLDPAGPKFDLVIFDEASQVPTAEAVGALARGHQAVIVGDPKQLPPTSFFSRMSGEAEEDQAVVEDLESILDDCLAIAMPERNLSWHYRSRHESLIAFSNALYYENKLMTFPSPDEPVSSVKWHPVEGTYDRGRSKQNRAEGEAVVAEIVRRLKDGKARGKSIGVVTFSSIQQSLIEDLLDEALRRDADLELLAANMPEPIFVKNLENVQGDERDVILFSVGYGPDPAGKVSLNFGPLNRQGGWRRLNVAVSRAREEMHVFSALHERHLSAGRISAEGVIGLKAFLSYAEKGKQALPASEITGGRAGEADIHRRLATELKRLGYSADMHVGTSGFRIDVAIRDPAKPGAYALGIVLDGPVYRDAQTARDRDILRVQVLKQLGWRIHRLWTPDWWDSREAEIRKIVSAMERGEASDTEETEKSAEPAKETAGTEEAAKPAKRTVGAEEAARPAKETAGAKEAAKPGAETDVARSAVETGIDAAEARNAAKTELTETAPNAERASHKDRAANAAQANGAGEPAPATDGRADGLPDGARWYRTCVLESVTLGTEAFYAPEYARLICDQLLRAIEEEGPISRGLLARRVLQAWGIARLGAKLDRRLADLLSRTRAQAVIRDGSEFFWPAGVDPEQYAVFRVASEESQRRAAEDLPPEEIAAAVRAVLASQISLPEDDLIKQTVRLLGYARSGPALEKAVQNGIALAIQRGFATADGAGRIVHRGE